MLDYVEAWYDTRGIDRGDEPIPCEWCLSRLANNEPGSLESGVGIMCDVHHVLSSFRGERKHSEDGYDIVGLCYKCHQIAHKNNEQSMRLELLSVAKEMIEIYSKLGDKDKLWIFCDQLYKGWKKENEKKTFT